MCLDQGELPKTVINVYREAATTTAPFKKGGFNLHKWNSNVPSLDSKSAEEKQELTYTKQILSQDSNEIKILASVGTKRKIISQ